MKELIRKIGKKWHIKKIVGLGFGFALLISVVSSIVSYKSTKDVLGTAVEMSDSHVFFGILKEVVSEINQVESYERGYAITGKDEYIEGCYKSVELIKSKLLQLKELSMSNSNRKIKIKLLEPVINSRFEITEKIIEERKGAGYESAPGFILNPKSRQIMGTIRDIIAQMEEEEKQTIETATIKAEIYSERIITILLLSNIITFVVLTSSLSIIFIDISQRNYFEKELIKAKEIAEKSVQVKEHFLANVSHEIRTPMNAVSGLSKILLRTNPTEEQKEYLDAIKTSSDILLVIINDILDLSKAQSGKMIFEKADFKLISLISSITDLLYSKAEEKSLKLITRFDKNIPDQLVGDAVRLNQIILNLVSNAIKFTEAGEIALMIKLIERKNNSVTLKFTVKDTGIGIPADKLENIFESFTQASTEITRKYGGTGLGLNIVKELVERQGGIISVQSEVNKGSTFSFALQFQVSREREHFQQTLPSLENSKIHSGSIHVLLVEDNKINQLVALTVLKNFGFQTDVADNGRIALEKIMENSYNLVLMDIQMPEMSGYEVTQRIRTALPEPFCNVPILAMTANASKADAEKCLNAGMNDYISKPFDEGNLYNKIYALIMENKQDKALFARENPENKRANKHYGIFNRA